jgi:tetratricopeptide (TPR) repeat protein
LKVKSRTSTSRYKESSKQLMEIASELGVANVIEGSVFRTGDQVRITVQLIDAATDENIWAKSYDRDVRDMLALQSEVAREVAKQVSVELTPDEVSRLQISRQVDPEVYETYLKGMFFVKQLDPVAIETGLDYLHDAVGIDPREPLAYAGIALGYNTIGHGVNSHGAFPKALAAARKALELDEWSGEAWAALAEAQLYYDWDWETAEANMLRALQLSPSLDHVHAHYAYLLMLLGRNAEAIEFSEKARNLSPVDPIWAGFSAWLYMVEGRWDEGIETAEECTLFPRPLDICLYALGEIYSAQGDFDKAVEVHERISAEDPFRNWSLGISYAQAGRHDDALKVIEAMAINATPRDQLHIALAYSAMGDIEQALIWLGVAYESRSDWLPWVVLPYAYGGSVEPLREEAGFKAIVDSMNIPVAQR